MEDKDINEGKYPSETIIFVFFVEIILLSISMITIYFTLNDSG